MSATRHARIGALYRQVRRLSRAEAARLLAEACADDTGLRHEVEELLAYAEDGAASDGFSESALAESRARLEAAVARPSALDPGWIPEAIGNYRIARRIGVGGMGAVYEGVQEAPHRRVAVKVLHPLLVTEERVRRFRREVEVLGRLQHPGIAQVYEAGSADLGRGEQPWFAMELVEGVDLRMWAREKALDTNARLALVAEVADAVHHAHERGIVHRDLKPDNVLVDATGRPRVLDFGVARVTESSTTLSTMETIQGQIVGTLTYMAPEQLVGDSAAVSARSDVYALGVIAFELLVGRRPIDAGELPVSAAVPLLLASEPTRLGSIDARLSGDVETIVGKALEKDPERRYASAAALAEDIRRHLAHHPIVARPPSALYRATKFTRRHRGLVSGAAIALVFLVVGILGVLRYAHGEAMARVEAERLSVDARAAGYASIGSLLDQGDVWGARAQLLRTPESARGWEWNWLEARGPLAFPGLEEALTIRSGRVRARRRNPEGSPFAPSIQVVDIAAPRAPWLEVEGLDGVLGALFVSGSPVAVEGLLRASGDWNAAPYRGAIGILDLEEARFTDVVPLEDPGAYVMGSADLRADFPVTTRLAGFRDGVLLLAGDGVLPGETAEGWSWVEVREPGPSGSIRRYEVHYPEAQNCALSPDGELALVFPHTDRVGPTVLVRIDGWQELGRIPSGMGRQGPKFRPDGKELATLVREDRIEVYGIPDLDLRRSLEVPSANSLAWFGTDRWITSGFGRLRVLAAETGAVLEEQRTNQTQGLPGLEPDRGLVAGLGGSSSELTVYELGAPPHGPFRELSGHGQFVYACAWSPDGSLLASAAPWDPEILLWDGWTGELVGRAPRAVDPPGEWGRMRNFPAPLFFSSAGELVTTEPVERVVRIVRIDVVTGKTSTGSPRRGNFDWNSFQCPPERVADLIECVDSTRAWSFGPRLVGHPDGRRVICTSFICNEVDRKVCVRGSRSEDDETSDLHGLGLSLAPDQERLAIGEVGKVHIVSLPGWRELETIEDLGGAVDRYYAVAWSPDGERLAVGSQSGRIQLLETTYFRPILELPPHGDYVYALAWSPDGTRLASASGDGTLRIHDTVHPIARRLQAEERAARVAAQAARLEALVAEHGDVASAAQALLAEAGDDAEAQIAARRACLLRWNRK